MDWPQDSWNGVEGLCILHGRMYAHVQCQMCFFFNGRLIESNKNMLVSEILLEHFMIGIGSGFCFRWFFSKFLRFSRNWSKIICGPNEFNMFRHVLHHHRLSSWDAVMACQVVVGIWSSVSSPRCYRAQLHPTRSHWPQQLGFWSS